jgi:hypothetical protein
LVISLSVPQSEGALTVFDPTRAACIDKISTTQVWRGNLPIDMYGRFAYHAISAALGLPSGAALIDVSLIDNIEGGERDRWQLELDAYGVSAAKEFPSGPSIPPQFNQPSWQPGRMLGKQVSFAGGIAPGHFVWWQIEGGATPDVLGPDARSYNFIGLIEYLGSLRTLKNAFVYIHCMNGTDRTGAVVAAYGIRWEKLTLEQAMAKADALPAAGTMSAAYRELVHAYWDWFSLGHR